MLVDAPFKSVIVILRALNVVLGVPIQFAITSSTNDPNIEFHSILTIKFHFGFKYSTPTKLFKFNQ